MYIEDAKEHFKISVKYCTSNKLYNMNDIRKEDCIANINVGSGGIVSGVDETCGLICSEGWTETGKRYRSHPDSGIDFIGYQIPKWNALLDIVKAAAYDIKEVKYIGGDMAFTDKSQWIFVEVDTVSKFSVLQC